MDNILTKLFPIGRSAKTPKVGLDISGHSLRFVELLPRGKGYVLGHFGEKKIPDGVMQDGKIKDMEELKTALSSLRSKYRMASVNVSVPGGKTHFIRMGLSCADGCDVRAAVESKIGEHLISGSSGDFVFDHAVISQNESECDVEVSLFPREIKEDYMRLFEGTGLTPSVFESEEKAIGRSVLPRGDKGTRMIIDFGRIQAGVFIVSKGIPMLAATLGLGEQIIIDAIKEKFGVSEEKAERMKREYGLVKSSNDRDFFLTLARPLSKMKDEIDKLFIYWRNYSAEQGKKSEKIESVILCGAGAGLPGLSDYLSANLRVPVSVANVWVNVNSFDEYIPEIPLNDSLRYAAAIGLALRGVYERE
ncbi:MAG: pilus assembly protein PilM [Candidatus Paceibacterota bacterium]|jgi:type IV pilus assembly protein PilM